MNTSRPKEARARHQQREQETCFASPEQEVEDDAKAFLEVRGGEKVIRHFVDVEADGTDIK